MPRPDPTTLLCESCGYPIGELPREGNCPECGRAIADSLPEHRVGTPWQQKRGFGNWARTVAMVARRPRVVWEVVKPEVRASLDLLALHCTLAAAGLAVWGVGYAIAEANRGDGAPRSAWKATLIGFAIAAFVLMGLCMIEYAGIRFFGSRRKWRVTHEVAMSVVGHASVGWLLLPLTLPLAWGFTGMELETAMDNATGVGGFGVVVAVIVFLAGPLIPLLAFELLVYEGVRRMRFANT